MCFTFKFNCFIPFQIDDKGLFNPDKAEEITKKFLTNEEEQKKALDIIKGCTASGS